VSVTADAAVLQARIDAGAYTVVGSSGSQPRPASVGEPVLVDLVRTDAGWRISALRAPG
jgi:eukaryotic-like serine/threonine-protein kinase